MKKDLQDHKAEAILYVPVTVIAPDPEGGNVGGSGRTQDTTDLQPSIRKQGVLKPLEVRPAAGDVPETFWLIDGYRRWTAARQVDPALRVPVIVRDVPQERLAELRAAFMMSQPHETIVLDDEAEVAGGWCRMVHELAFEGRHNYEIAQVTGMTTDVVGALVRLYDEKEAVKRAVADGRMAITAYSLLKTAPEELKAYVVGKRGQITASNVRDILRNWEDIRQRQQAEREEPEPDRADAALESDPATGDFVSGQQDEDQPTAYLLNGALQRLRQAGQRELKETDYYILEQIQKELERLV